MWRPAPATCRGDCSHGTARAGHARRSQRLRCRAPTAIDEARRRQPGIEFFVHDALQASLPSGFDVVSCSLFLHHLDNDSVVSLLANMEAAAQRLVLVNDLSRSRFNFVGVWLATRLLTLAIVHFDGPASVRSAFTPAEAIALAARAGLHGAIP